MRAALKDEISKALSRPNPPALGELDRLLTDCAAEALRLHREMGRLEHEIDATLIAAPGSQPEVAAKAPGLLRRRRRLAAESRRLSELMEALRARRDRTPGSATANG